MEEAKIEGLVLNIFEKNEYDAIVKILSEDSIVFLLVKSFFKPNNKNKNNIMIGSISEFEYFLNYGKNNYFLLKRATLKYFLNYTDKQHQQNLANLYSLLNQLEVANNNFYETYKNYLKDKDFYHTSLLITYFTNIIFKINGQEFNHSSCSICGSYKNIFCLDLYEGGLLCYQHKKPNSITDLKVLKAFHYLNQDFNHYKKYSDEVINNKLFLMFKDFSLY